MLQGNTDPRLLELRGPNGRLYRWYRLKEIKEPKDTPTWPRDMDLERVMELKSIRINGGIESIKSLKLRRDLKIEDDQHQLHLLASKYSPQTDSSVSVNDPKIPLEGFWGRADVSDDFETICSCASRSSLQKLLESNVGPVVSVDEVMEIKRFGGERSERQIRFLGDIAHFSPALTVYQLIEDEAKKWIKKHRPRIPNPNRLKTPAGGPRSNLKGEGLGRPIRPRPY